jgi:tRNA-dihydrouridine synthase A
MNRDTYSHRFCIAPMLDWTDRHERYFLRLLCRHARLYTEMVTTGALLHGDVQRHLGFDPAEHPVALQLGGSDPAELARCAALGEETGFDEINLNVGCPSDRVQSGRFGACLMADARLVAEGVRAMKRTVNVPITVKCRTGINELDSDAFLANFIGLVSDAGCDALIIHARIAILEGLSPKENREIPPLNYPRVYRMKQSFPHLRIVINGGIRTLEQAQQMLTMVDGVMIGREAYHNPWLLSNVDEKLFGEKRNVDSRTEALQKFLPYVERELEAGTSLQHITRHILGIFHGVPGGKAFRRHLSENAWRRNAGLSVLEDAMSKVSEYAWSNDNEDLSE